MSVAGTQDVAIEVLGGLVTQVAPADLPHGLSPDCADVQFQIGSVKTRPGVTSKYTLAGNPTVNYLKTFENLQEVPRLLSLDSLGNLRTDVSPGGALALISSGIIPGSFCKSCSLFAREYLAFGNGTEGLDIPRQYDDTNFDRLSQVGPGEAPSVADENLVVNVLASPNGVVPYAGLAIANISQSGSLVTVQISGVFNFSLYHAVVGDPIRISGVGVAGYNGVFAIATVIDPSTVTYINGNASGLASSSGGTAAIGGIYVQLSAPVTAQLGQLVLLAGVTIGTYNGTWMVRTPANNVSVIELTFPPFGSSPSGSGTFTFAGNIATGLHQLSVIFVTRNRYYTKPAPPTSWVAGGGKRALVTNIPIGPSNIIARILCFTGVGGASFYHLGPSGLTIASSNMYIADNVTTSLTVDFSDQVLLLGTLDDPLFNQIVLPPVAGIIDYSNRNFAWGEQANIQNLLNLSFDGGWAAVPSGFPLGRPLGWSANYSTPTAGSRNPTSVSGDAFAWLGGATGTFSFISQPAYQDYLGVNIFQPNVDYSVNIRLRAAALAGVPTVGLQVFSPSAGVLGEFAIAANLLTANYGRFSGQLMVAQAVIPSDTELRYFVRGIWTSGDVSADEIEIFPTDEQFNNSNLRASKGQLDTQGQESFDSQIGLIQWNLNDGQSVRTAFKIRERLYIVKEHSFGVTQDDGVNEPSGWTVDDVSKKVGTPSVNGVGIGEDWVVIAHRTGLYLYWGGAPEKISEEIQPTWDSINWLYGFTISVTVDTRRRRIFVCAPFGASTVPNETLVLDYHDVGSDAAAIASSPPVHLTYTGRKTAFDKARKWCPWTIPANCVAQIEQGNLQTQVYFGSNDGTGNINVLDDSGAVFTDNGAVIPSYYTTAFFVEQPQEQALKLGEHRKLFSYLTMYAQGQGSLGLTVYQDSLQNGLALNPLVLSNPANFDLEEMLNILRERMALKISSSGVGQWFDFQKAVVNVKSDPWAPVRGY